MNAAEADEVAPKRSHSRRRAALEWGALIVVALIASLLVRAYVVQTFSIPSASTEPTLLIGDRIVVDKLAVRFGTIHVGDIIVFKAPPAVRQDCADAVADLVKRVIGLPGDHLSSRGDTIYVNGTALKENWSHREPLGTAIGHVTVPTGHYFVMGDYHDNSCDSRTWGTVARGDVIGKVFMRIWPLSRATWF